MNLFETEFLFCILSSFFLFHSLFRISDEGKRSELIFQWTLITVVGFFITEILKKWGIHSLLWNSDSLFLYIAKSNLLLFLTYFSFEESWFSFQPVRRFFFFGLLFVFWIGVMFGIHFFQTTILVQDNTLILPFAISLGAFVWIREMFWSLEGVRESTLGDDSARFVYLSVLPATFLVFSPWKTEVNFYNQVSAIVIYGISSFVGFLFVSKLKKEIVPASAEIGIWIGTLAFSSCLGTEILVVLPLAFLSGIFGRLIYSHLSSLRWSESGIRGVLSFLYPATLGIFLPFLLVEANLWVHSPYVLLGVQVLYFLSFYLVACLFFGIILLFKQK
ncbi:hypothetical protein [Leptospira harrisiae]|uniref:Uncharacterized protein n=1 Tax=Leptospira harrisiae TaxID=2023189 RepID=A0A2N0AMT5_9LEPT|nr:hypothetical protein [Leptospira harrisiae]PJZ85550.1 hypothetical protein CH364_04855 [Leptospira harrisiae]PKA09086.1 hypothetical protein CH366_04995 [Leptospira harrisiae]